MPLGETAVMVLTVVPTVLTDNLAIGVGVGVLTSTVLFARRVARLLTVERTVSGDGASVRYRAEGALFFASNQDLTEAFHHPDDPAHVVIDLSDAHVWDASAVAALDAIGEKYAARGATVEIVGLNAPSGDLHGTLSGRLAGAH
jgi:SulP family sulfate permease